MKESSGGENCSEEVLNIHTPFYPQSHPNLFAPFQLSDQKNKLFLGRKNIGGLFGPPPPFHSPGYTYEYLYTYDSNHNLEIYARYEN